MSKQDLFEGIPQEIVIKTLNNIFNNLSKIIADKKNGHAITFHTDKDDETLLSRIYNENISAATCFYSTEIAKQACLGSLQANWNTVCDFLQTSEREISFIYDAKQEIGYGYKKDVDGVYEDLTTLIIILKKDDSIPWGFFIKNAYPIITKSSIPEFIKG